MKTLQSKPNSPIDPSEFTLSFLTEWDRPIRYYDDGFGTLWIFCDSMGIVGIVRAQTWEDAYEIVADEFLPVVKSEDLHEAYGMTAEEFAAFEALKSGDCPDLVEGYSFQSNSSGETGIVSHDLNGESLNPLTLEEIERLEIKMTIIFGDK